jgi:hypothetical protein
MFGFGRQRQVARPQRVQPSRPKLDAFGKGILAEEKVRNFFRGVLPPYTPILSNVQFGAELGDIDLLVFLRTGFFCWDVKSWSDYTVAEHATHEGLIAMTRSVTSQRARICEALESELREIPGSTPQMGFVMADASFPHDTIGGAVVRSMGTAVEHMLSQSVVMTPEQASHLHYVAITTGQLQGPPQDYRQLDAARPMSA